MDIVVVGAGVSLVLCVASNLCAVFILDWNGVPSLYFMVLHCALCIVCMHLTIIDGAC